MSTPTLQVYSPPPHPVPWWDLVNPDLVAEYVELVRDTRKFQQLHQQTGDPVFKREGAKLEHRVDEITGLLADVIAATRPAAEEGGAL